MTNNLFQDPSTEQGLPGAFGPQDLCTPRGLATSPTVVPSHQTHIRASSSTLTLDKSHTLTCHPTHSSHPTPPPRILPHLRSRPTAYPSHSSSSRPKRQAAPSTFPARPPRACSTLPFPVKLTSPQGGSISERHPWGLLSPKLKSRLILPFHGHHRPRPAPIVRPRSRVPVPRPRHRGISIVQRPYHPQSHNPGAQLPKPVANPALSIPVVGGLGRLGFPTGTYGMMPAFSHECVHPSHRVPSPCVSTCVGATTSLPGQINSVPIRSAHTRPARSRRNLAIDRH